MFVLLVAAMCLFALVVVVLGMAVAMARVGAEADQIAQDVIEVEFARRREEALVG